MPIDSVDFAGLMRRALACRDAGESEASERLLRDAAAACPGEAEPHHHLGVLHANRDQLGQAEAEFRRALAFNPGAFGTQRLLAILLLSQGRFDEGFAHFEARHQLPEIRKPSLPFPEWRGEELAGKRLLIWPEQGFGDQIQFARFAPILQARGIDVTLLCRRPLQRLFAASLGVRVIAADGAVEFPDPDAWIMTMSLAWRMGVTVETIPGAPYLRASTPGPDLGGVLKVGLVARGNPANGQDARRSLPPEIEARLRALPCRVVGLDPKETGALDFADTAALVAQLDLVISVDTAVAHLAGAMGKSCWTLLPKVGTDWRWLRGRADTPWYPGTKLYRQATDGDWGQVIDRVERDVAMLPD
jgi:hypothetical protein